MAHSDEKEGQKMYASNFCPNNQAFNAVHNRLGETGMFKVNMRDHFVVLSLKNLFYSDLKKTQRPTANDLGCSKNTVWRVLHEERLYPYKPQKVQALKPQDYPHRENCDHWFLHRYRTTFCFSKKYISQVELILTEME